MTIELFIYLFTVGSAISSLVTQATKKAFPAVSSNVLALVDAFLVGTVGTLSAYTFLNIPFTAQNVIIAVLMGACLFIGSTVGYDKVIQTINQLRR